MKHLIPLILLISCSQFTDNHYQNLKKGQDDLLAQADTSITELKELGNDMSYTIKSLDTTFMMACRLNTLVNQAINYIEYLENEIDSLRKENEMYANAITHNQATFNQNNVKLQRESFRNDSIILDYCVKTRKTLARNDSALFSNQNRFRKQSLNNDSAFLIIMYENRKDIDSIFRVLQLNRFGGGDRTNYIILPVDSVQDTTLQKIYNNLELIRDSLINKNR